MNLYPIIKLLSDGLFHTGTELGSTLGISRTAVWKQVQRLPSFGLNYISDKQKGYRLIASLDLLQKNNIIEALAVDSLINPIIEIFPLIGSTNTELLDRANQGQVIHQVLLTAEMQEQGKGRRGRIWVSPFATSLSCSLGWHFEDSAQKLQGLSLAIGVVLVQALQKTGISNLGLKWPNDIYLHNKKLGGILIEITGDLAGPCRLVIGYGLNITPPLSPLKNPPDQPLAYLSEAKRLPFNRSQLVACLYSSIIKLMSTYGHQGFAPYKNAWNRLHVWKGRDAMVMMPLTNERVRLGDVNSMGELQVTDKQGQLKYLNSGEVSLRVSS